MRKLLPIHILSICSVVQLAAGINLPAPVLITKSLIFLLLGIYAVILAKKIIQNDRRIT